MTRSRRELGQLGENTACKYLKENGYEILECNYRTSFGELDIVARDREELVFVEVRTRSSRKFGIPEESIDRRKQKKLKQLVAIYLSRITYSIKSWRIDIVAVETDKDYSIQEIRHIKNAL